MLTPPLQIAARFPSRELCIHFFWRIRLSDQSRWNPHLDRQHVALKLPPATQCLERPKKPRGIGPCLVATNPALSASDSTPGVATGSVVGQEPKQNESTLESPFRKTQNSALRTGQRGLSGGRRGGVGGRIGSPRKFFKHMPAETGMAFVVVQHLSPDFKSLMDELLSRRTAIPIHRVEDGMAVEPNAIYLIPPKKEMIISGGRLLLTDKDPAHGLTLPIDIFFRSLAQDVATAGDRRSCCRARAATARAGFAPSTRRADW